MSDAGASDSSLALYSRELKRSMLIANMDDEDASGDGTSDSPRQATRRRKVSEGGKRGGSRNADDNASMLDPEKDEEDSSTTNLPLYRETQNVTDTSSLAISRPDNKVASLYQAPESATAAITKRKWSTVFEAEDGEDSSYRTPITTNAQHRPNDIPRTTAFDGTGANTVFTSHIDTPLEIPDVTDGEIARLTARLKRNKNAKDNPFLSDDPEVRLKAFNEAEKNADDAIAQAMNLSAVSDAVQSATQFFTNWRSFKPPTARNTKTSYYQPTSLARVSRAVDFSMHVQSTRSATTSARQTHAPTPARSSRPASNFHRTPVTARLSSAFLTGDRSLKLHGDTFPTDRMDKEDPLSSFLSLSATTTTTMSADASIVVGVCLLNAVGGQMRELEPITIHPYSCDLPFIVKSIVALNSTLNDCTIEELLTAYPGSMKLFISWAAIPQNVAGLQNLQDSFVQIESPDQVKEFLNYLAQRKKACIIVELLSQDEYDWKTSLDKFCRTYKVFPEDKKALIKLRMHPGSEKFDTLSREEWQGCAGLPEMAYRSLVKKNGLYAQSLSADVSTT